MPLTAVARAASDASRDRAGFEARQSLRAGGIEVSARVRALRPDRVAVDYSAYKSPLAEMDDLLGGSAELAPGDLAGASLLCDGQTTWYVNPQATAALSSPGRRLYEPVPGCDALGEIGFLDDLTRDFLLRDGGETSHAGRPARILGLKPKRQRVSSLLRITTFIAERAEITLDAETYFPLRITFQPGRGTIASSVLGAEDQITIDYSDIRLAEPDASTFTPTLAAGTRVFAETFCDLNDGAIDAPFPLPIDALRKLGIRPVDGRALLVLDAARERGYATLPCTVDSSDGEAALLLRVGNYVSRLMARRRTLAGERGELVQVGDLPARYLDRHKILDAAPEAAGIALPADLVWDHEGLFWVLTSEGFTKDEVLALAANLI